MTVRYSSKVALRGDLALLSGNPTVVLSRNEGGANNWGQVAALSPCDEGTLYDNNAFGESVYELDTHSPFAIDDGQHFIVGAIKDDEGGDDAGAAYVFALEPSGPPHALRIRRTSGRRIKP
jgi:hypothetical protein